MGFDWSDQKEDVIPNQALMTEVTDEPEIPTQVQFKLYIKSTGNTNIACVTILTAEQCRRESTLIIASFEEQVKAYQANDLQHNYDQNYWKWEKNELAVKLGKSQEELEKVKSELEKVKLDIEKYSNASKVMNTLLKTQVHEKMKRGIGYNTIPPPYNNNYIPPISDLLEGHEDKEILSQDQ